MVDKPPEGPKPDSQRFENATKAFEPLQATYNDWSKATRELGVQAAYAVLAGLLVIHGTAGKLTNNHWAIASLIVTFLVIGGNLLFTSRVSALCLERITEGEKSKQKWDEEYQNYLESGGPFPYTEQIENLGKARRVLNAWGPIVGGVFMIVSMFATKFTFLFCGIGAR